MSTPRNPPLNPGTRKWNAMTASTASARTPSSAGSLPRRGVATVARAASEAGCTASEDDGALVSADVVGPVMASVRAASEDGALVSVDVVGSVVASIASVTTDVALLAADSRAGGANRSAWWGA